MNVQVTTGILIAPCRSSQKVVSLASRVLAHDPDFSRLASWSKTFDRPLSPPEKRLLIFGPKVVKKRGETTRFPTRIPAASSPALRKRVRWSHGDRERRENERAYAYSGQVKGCIVTSFVDGAVDQTYYTCHKSPFFHQIKSVHWLRQNGQKKRKITYRVPTKKTADTCNFRFIDKCKFQVQKSGNSSMTKSDSILKIPVE